MVTPARQFLSTASEGGREITSPLWTMRISVTVQCF